MYLYHFLTTSPLIPSCSLSIVVKHAHTCHTYTCNLLSSFSVVHVYVDLELAAWDWLTYQELLAGADTFPSLSAVYSSSSSGGIL